MLTILLDFSTKGKLTIGDNAFNSVYHFILPFVILLPLLSSSNYKFAFGMKKIILVFVLGILTSSAFGQGVVKGTIRDTSSFRNLPFVSVTIITQEDSSLVQFARTNGQGEFEFKGISGGGYILLTALSKYVDYIDAFTLKEGGTKDFGQIAFTQRAQLLKSVVIKDYKMVRIKGDTLSYLADSFNVRKGANVEDLLKVLPGMQVDKDGQITVMGEKVQKVLVNGEEFFGSDPTIATRNMQSDVVESVEVFDQKSEQAAFTGFDDGEEVKTINLKLKKKKSQGFFGKVEAGAGWEDRWDNQAMVNWFEGKRQISAYGLMNSNGKTGLGWEDNRTFGSGGGGRMFGGGREETQIISSFFEDEEENNFGNFGRGADKPGVNKTWTGGARYANKLEDGKHNITANYSQGRLTQDLNQRSYTENITPTFTSLRDDTTNTRRVRNIHNLSSRYEWKIDSLTAIVYKMNTRLQFKDYSEQSNANNRTDAEVPLSKNTSDINRSTNTSRVTNDLTLNRKLNKKGRTLSVTGSHTYNKKKGEGFLLSTNSFGGSTQSIDQRKLDNSTANSLMGTVSYTEPLHEKLLLRLGYGISNDIADLSTRTQDTLGYNPGSYLNQIDSLSNEFDMNILRNSGLVEFMYKRKKMNLTVGTAVANTRFRQQDLIRNENYDYSRINLFPSLKFRYKFSQFKRIDLRYTGNTTNPTAQQLQPILNNNNPLELTIGNPDLQIGFKQNIRINYFTFQALEGKGMWAGAFFQNAFNPVGVDRTFDLTGRTINRYVNLSSNLVISSWLGGMMKLGKKGWEGRMTISGSYSDMPSIINGVESRNKSWNSTINPSFTYNKENKIFLTFEPNVNYTFTKNDVGQSRTISYFSYSPTLGVSYYLPKDFELGTDMDYTFTPAVDPYPEHFDRFIWDAYVSKRVLPKKNLELRFQVWDILNQNLGYTRMSSNNYNTENFYNTLQRYWMVSAVWNFFSGPLAESKANGNKFRHGPKRRNRR